MSQNGKTAEDELSRQQEKLEELVYKRTACLMETNQQLQKEINERIQTEHLLRESERFLDNVFFKHPGRHQHT
jgi:C4-dicarboxylate-specific signal transduction histidine kinase